LNELLLNAVPFLRLLLELDYIIRKRQFEPKYRTGFWQIDPMSKQGQPTRAPQTC
jgi:hypothetical protein